MSLAVNEKNCLPNYCWLLLSTELIIIGYQKLDAYCAISTAYSISNELKTEF